MYEQIYALAGPTQTYRDHRRPADPAATSRAPSSCSTGSTSTGTRAATSRTSTRSRSTREPSRSGANQGKKNWNSVGDHAPAYLINLYLATGEERYADFLEYTVDTIAKYFPDYDNSPFVQERFFEDWSHDTTLGLAAEPRGGRPQPEDRLEPDADASACAPNDKYVALASKIARAHAGGRAATSSAAAGTTWWSASLQAGQECHRFAWHDRKAWWQQEQAILAYLILHGSLGDERVPASMAREAAAFYNAFFLDHDDGAVYFNVLANGMPYLMGNERLQGQPLDERLPLHPSCATWRPVYTNLLITKQPLDFYFKPHPGGFKDNMLRVAPDILPPGQRSHRRGRGSTASRTRTSTPTGLTVKLAGDATTAVRGQGHVIVPKT